MILCLDRENFSDELKFPDINYPALSLVGRVSSRYIYQTCNLVFIKKSQSSVTKCIFSRCKSIFLLGAVMSQHSTVSELRMTWSWSICISKKGIQHIFSTRGHNVGEIFQEHVKTFNVYSIFMYAAFLMARGTTYPKVSNKTGNLSDFCLLYQPHKSIWTVKIQLSFLLFHVKTLFLWNAEISQNHDSQSTT